MGAGPSASRKVKVATPGMLDLYAIDQTMIDSMRETENMTAFKVSLEKVIEYHANVMRVYQSISTGLGGNDKKTVTLDQKKHIDKSTDDTPPFLLFLQETYGNNGDDEGVVELLFDINAVHENYIPASNNTLEREMMVFKDFEIGYQRFIQLLERIKTVDEVKIELNGDVIDQNNRELVRKYTLAGEIVNKFLARVMFLQYAIAYNDYLSLVYTMFAARLFRDLDVMYIIAKKRHEFTEVIEQLQSSLKDNFTTISEERDKMRAQTNVAGQNLAKSYNDAFDKLFAAETTSEQQGGNPDDGSIPNGTKLGELVRMHADKLEMYKLSNVLLERYFEMINYTIKLKFDDLRKTYEQTKNNKTLISTNLTKALADVINAINAIDSEPYVNMQKWGVENRWSKTLSPEWKKKIKQILEQNNIQFDDPVETEQFYNWVSDGVFLTEFDKMESYMVKVAERAARHVDTPIKKSISRASSTTSSSSRIANPPESAGEFPNPGSGQFTNGLFEEDRPRVPSEQDLSPVDPDRSGIGRGRVQVPLTENNLRAMSDANKKQNGGARRRRPAKRS